MESPTCLNCGTALTDRFCPRCGQKAQPTRLPLRELLGEASSTFLNLDGLLWRTLLSLFLHPGQATLDYNAGRRVRYLPPLRIYLSISVIYFLTVELLDSNRVFFVDISSDEGAVGVTVQYALFLLVPVLAGLLQLLRCRRGAYYVEYLVWAVHLHSVWFGLFWLDTVLGWSVETTLGSDHGVGAVLSGVLSSLGQLFPLIYLVLSLRRAFALKWWQAAWRAAVSMVLYALLLALAIAGFFAIATL